MEYRPLCWDGRLLTLGEPVTEMARLALDGTVLARGIGPGDWVALHWDWVCDKLTDRQLARAAHVHHAPPGHGQPPRRAPRPGRHPGLSPIARARASGQDLEKLARWLAKIHERDFFPDEHRQQYEHR